MWTRLSERVSQEHLQLQPQCLAFTCCERLFKTPYWLLSARSTRSKCQIWHCVGKEYVMPMFANECFLQDLPALAAKLSKCEKFVSHKPACTRMQRTAGHIFPSSTCKNCCFANKRGCWVCTYMHSVACSKCEPASQREFLRSIYSFNRSGPHLHAANAHSKLPTGCFLQDLPAPSVKFGIALEKNAWCPCLQTNFFARSARSSCQNIQMWELYRSQACL